MNTRNYIYKSAVFVFLASMIFLIVSCQQTLASQTEESIASLRVAAIEAQADGDLDKAEDLYTKALANAENSGSAMKIIEFLSRLVQVKIENRKLRETDELVSRALETANKIQNSHSNDSNLTVWMDDMAEAFYSRGERSQNAKVKDFCCDKYLKLKLAVADRYSTKLMGRANIYILSLERQEKYSQAVPIIQQLVSYAEKADSQEPKNISAFYYRLGVNYLGAREPAKAESAFNRCLDIEKQAGKDPMHVIYIERYTALAKLQENKLADAESFCRTYVGYHSKFIGPANEITAGDYIVLGSILEKSGKIAEASKYYQMSLDAFDQRVKHTPCSLDAAAGQMAAAEALAHIESESGKKVQAKALQARAAQIRRQHPNWIISPTDTYSFLLGGQMPCLMDSIPTKVKFPL